MTIHVPTQPDLFGSDDPLIGLKIHFDREIDQHQPCHDNLTEISGGRGPHCYALLCAACGRHRGWLPKQATDFIKESIRVAGVPRGPLIYRDATNAKATAGAAGLSDASAPREGEEDMDMSKYSGAAFLKVGEVKDNGPMRVVIAEILLGKYGKPDVSFSDGCKLSLNATNNKILCHAYGTESEDWIGKEIELFVGDIDYQGKPQEAILVRPITPSVPLEQQPKPKHKKRDDFDTPTDL
jgi:hypothetical protein